MKRHHQKCNGNIFNLWTKISSTEIVQQINILKLNSLLWTSRMSTELRTEGPGFEARMANHCHVR